MTERENILEQIYERIQGESILATPRDEPGKRKPYVPPSLTWALWIAMSTVVAITLAGVTSLFLAGFQVSGFVLDSIVLASLVGGMSIQSAAAIVSPLAKGIAEVIKEQYKSRHV